MKNIKKMLLMSVLSVASIYTDAQTKSELYPDELVLSTDAQIDVTFRFYRISDKEVYLKDDLWESILNIMSTAVESAGKDEGVKVIYSKVTGDENKADKVEVKEIENNSDVFLIGKDGVKEIRSNRIEFEIYLHKVAISFTLNDLDDLDMIKELSVESVWSQIDQKFENEGKRNLYFGDGKFNYGNAQIDQLEAKETGNDNIEITFIGIGMGYYRDRFVPDIGSKLSFNLQDRLGNDWMEFGVLYTQQYFFSRDQNNDYRADLNGWVTGFCKVSMKNGEELGIGIGGLVHRDGGYFEGSTWKLSLYNQGSNSKFTFSPELIFTNDFKDVFPALRFGLSF